MRPLHVIGGGLAGSEAAWQAAEAEPEEEEEAAAGHAVPVALHRGASRRAGGAFQS